jgi:hypothetical protein
LLGLWCRTSDAEHVFEFGFGRNFATARSAATFFEYSWELNPTGAASAAGWATAKDIFENIGTWVPTALLAATLLLGCSGVEDFRKNIEWIHVKFPWKRESQNEIRNIPKPKVCVLDEG